MVIRHTGRLFSVWQALGCLCLTGCLCLLTNSATAQDLSVWTAPAWQSAPDAEFVHQLLDRGLTDLARQFCERRIDGARTVEERAEWELMLTECFSRMAWSMTTQNRSSLIHLAAERLTEFLKREPVPPLPDLMIRLRQMELLTEFAEMQSMINQASRWYVAEGGRLPRHSEGQRYGEALHQQELTHVREMGEALLDQVNQVRRQLDAESARLLRERIRRILMDVTRLQGQFAADASTAIPLLDAAGQGYRQLLQSASEDYLKQQLQLRTAEIELLKGDLPAFRLRMPDFETGSPLSANQIRWLPLHVRGLLREGRPSQALQQIISVRNSGVGLNQEMVCLKLETLLALFELVDTLGDDAVRQNVAQEFQQHLATAQTATQGVWREATERIASRQRRVSLAGAAVADELEAVEQLSGEGRVDDARGLLLRLINELPPSGRKRSEAALQLQYGELSIRSGEWEAAATALQKSAELYQSLSDQKTAAAADLLRVYSVGRLWESSPDASAARDAYEGGLLQHIEAFDGITPTTITAREWLVRLTKKDQPLRAARVLLTLFESTPETSEQFRWLIEAGELLVLRAASDHSDTPSQNTESAATTVHRSTSPDDPESTAALQKDFQRLSDTLLRSENRLVPNAVRGHVRLLNLELSLLTSTSGQEDWERLGKDVAKARQELSRAVGLPADLSPAGLSADTASSPDTPVRDTPSSEATIVDIETVDGHSTLISRCDRLGLVAGVRTNLEADKAEAMMQSLLQLSGSERLRTVAFLHRQYAGKSRTPGDVLLARSVLRLLQLPVNRVAETADRIALLPFAVSAAAVTGDNELRDRLMESLLSASLDDSERDAMASVLGDSSLTAVSAATQKLAADFWKNVLKRSKQGSQQWLEASLQIATAHERSGEKEEAQRILNVVDVLYPDWGTPNRQRLAGELRKKLMETKP